MTLIQSFVFLIVLFVLELVYFRLADHFNIIDHPNERSSHTTVTLRGGGIIFCIAGLLFYFFFGFSYPYFTLGLVGIATVSFLDDILTLNNKVRLLIHLVSVLLLFFQWNLFAIPWYWVIIAAIFVIGTINAYNFMDGINGITGMYSLVCMLSLYYINQHIGFTSGNLLIMIGLSLLTFNFFNFRKRARCFAGDVGSVAIAFILIFLIGQLILKTSNISYILLLLIYGLDASTTILFRTLRKENIFQAHRSHFYQHLANQLKVSHLIVAAGYSLIQLLVNCILFKYVESTIAVTILLVNSTVLFFLLRFIVEGRKVLLGK